ncbi:unnamed protein product, partial [Adineta steineri]
MAFDSNGNIFVTDPFNNQIRKFDLLTNFCDETTSAMVQTTTELLTTTNRTIFKACLPPTVTLIPDTSPIEFRRSQNFYISSIIQFNCNSSLSMTTKWTIKNCSLNCSHKTTLDQQIITPLSELYIPSRTLAYGIYQLELTVTMINLPSLIRSSSSSVYVRIIPSTITANLVQLGTSMITRGNQQDLTLDPGTFSINPNENLFDTNNWNYEYYCRVYGLYEFPNLNGSLLSIDDERTDPSNPSCLSNQSNTTSWKFDGTILSPTSSLIILADSLKSNRTYQFMVQMENRQNSLIQSIEIRPFEMSTNTSSLSTIYSNKGHLQLVLDNFVFKLNKRTETKNYWKCTVMNCPVHIHTNTNNDLINTKGEHNHFPESEDFLVKKFRAVLKERVVNETIAIEKIYDEEITKAKFSSDMLASIPLIHHMQSGLNRARRKLTPTLPTSNLFDIPPAYQTTASGETFLICDKMISRKKRMLVFSSPKQLQLLFEGSMVFLDGTFLATPPCFDQIFTIHCLKFESAFPCVFAVLPDRKKSTYQELFKELKSIAISMGQIWQPEQIMSDFETSLMPAVSTEFPMCVHKGCYYHYSQCLYRRIQSSGLAVDYTHDESLRSCCKKLMALPFLPVDEVETSFYTLRTTADQEVKKKLRDIFLYFDNYWLNTVPVEMWNVYGCNNRTNNICEGYHSRLNRRIERAHGNIWSFIKCIINEESRFQHLYVQIITGAQRRPTPRSKNNSQRLWTTDQRERMMIAFSPVSTFQVRLPAGLLHMMIYIRDSLDCITEFNMSSVNVTTDFDTINDLINNIQNSTTNPFVRILVGGNQNLVGQVIISVSQQFNKMNIENIDNAVLNGIPATSISISFLESQSSQGISTPLNDSALIEYKKELNSLANVRDQLIKYLVDLQVSDSNSIKLQSLSFAQLTQSTNQLTRTVLMLVSNKCYQLSLALRSMATRIAYEDVQIAAAQLIQCATNVLSAVNGPLQERTLVLDLDFSRATAFPTDYDTDIESEWSNLNLFANGNDFSWKTIEQGRNIYYQKQLATTISNQMNEIISLLTSTLNIHINIGQNLTINTPSTFMSLESISIESLSNKQIPQVGNARVNIPKHFNSNINDNSAVMLRSIMEPLAVYGSSKSQSANTNVSTSISLSVVDRNGYEVTIKTNETYPIEIIIPHDPSLIIPSMIIENVTSINSTFHNQLFSYHYMNITNTLPISAHIEIHPLETNISYLFIYKFDQIPQLNTSINQIDGWTLFCSLNLTNESIYTYFIDNQQTFGHQSIIFGLRELNSTEIQDFCVNSSIVNPPIT